MAAVKPKDKDAFSRAARFRLKKKRLRVLEIGFS
jgi:hypothetical protein